MKGVIFDKDGTLFDFQRTWGPWAAQVIAELAGGDPALAMALARAIEYDTDRRRFRPESVVIAGTEAEVAEVLSAAHGGLSYHEIMAILNAAAVGAALVPVLPLGAFFAELKARGLKTGVATNDSERAAKAHLMAEDAKPHVDFIAGFDSGFGGKPGPGQLLAFAEASGLDPSEIAMVGDSLHDLHAGRAAGMATVGVLTGPASEADLAPYADVVLNSIADLAAWLDRQT